MVARLNEIRIIVDASWGLRSTMGGVIMYNQTFHKVWSRRISTVCLSSAESEVHAIAEGIKEALSFSVIVETLLNGLPKKDSVGIFVQTGTSLPLVCFSDSEAGIHISNMSGLLRKVRHLQLRALLVQQMVQEERLVMRFVSGEDNPSDFLTKCSDSWHLSLLIYLLGIEQNEKDEMVEQYSHSFAGKLNLSGQNYHKMVQGIQAGLRKFLGPVCEEPKVDVVSTSVPSSVDTLCKCPSKKTISFNEDVQVFEVECENFGAYRAIPRRWQSWLNKHPELSHLKKPLGKFCGGYPLIVELCCELDSAIRRLCQKRCVPYIGIDRNINVKSSCLLALCMQATSSPLKVSKPVP